MTSYVPVRMRRAVIRRAKNCCEYCLLPQSVDFIRFQMEHIIAEKHGGTTSLNNLALSCATCNLAKGSDIGSLDPQTGLLTPFFHPRDNQWSDHFRLDDNDIIQPLSPEGRVTVKLLKLNAPEQVAKRRLARLTSDWPVE